MNRVTKSDSDEELFISIEVLRIDTRYQSYSGSLVCTE